MANRLQKRSRVKRKIKPNHLKKIEKFSKAALTRRGYSIISPSPPLPSALISSPHPLRLLTFSALEPFIRSPSTGRTPPSLPFQRAAERLDSGACGAATRSPQNHPVPTAAAFCKMQGITLGELSARRCYSGFAREQRVSSYQNDGRINSPAICTASGKRTTVSDQRMWKVVRDLQRRLAGWPADCLSA